MAGLSAWIYAVLLQAAVPAPAPETPAQPPAAEPAPRTGDKGGASVDELVVTAPLQKPELKLNFDLRGDFGPGPDQPYLRQRPVKGCKPMAGGATHPMNKSGVASGIVCAWRF